LEYVLNAGHSFKNKVVFWLEKVLSDENKVVSNLVALVFILPIVGLEMKKSIDEKYKI
jgi:hypothetical protein